MPKVRLSIEKWLKKRGYTNLSEIIRKNIKPISKEEVDRTYQWIKENTRKNEM